MHYFKFIDETVLILIIIIFFITSSNRPVRAGEVLLREDFNNLENWKPLEFPKIKEHTKYSVVTEDGRSYLKAESDASASGLIFKKEFNVYDYPILRWRWKVSNVFAKGDASRKSGDDYPLRVYVIFKYAYEKASFGKRIKYGLAKRIYGEYPPDSSINYIWANRAHSEDIITNAYADEAKMILLQKGHDNVGKWIEQEVDIIRDYRRAFGKNPPKIASLAVMSDSDNTGEHAEGYLDYIEVFK